MEKWRVDSVKSDSMFLHKLFTSYTNGTIHNWPEKKIRTNEIEQMHGRNIAFAQNLNQGRLVENPIL